ncbi:hypothetical protein [Saccharothrix sp. HUAS TT1]|uniref:hypothetical protein n=1 Tax=unclassified Saccharothrix TaxID=2593673 RepID=UPI00345B558A
MDQRLITIAAIVLIVSVLAGPAWFAIARVAEAAPARVGIVIMAPATFATASAAVISAFGQ